MATKFAAEWTRIPWKCVDFSFKSTDLQWQRRVERRQRGQRWHGRRRRRSGCLRILQRWQIVEQRLVVGAADGRNGVGQFRPLSRISRRIGSIKRRNQRIPVAVQCSSRRIEERRGHGRKADVSASQAESGDGQRTRSGRKSRQEIQRLTRQIRQRRVRHRMRERMGGATQGHGQRNGSSSWSGSRMMRMQSTHQSGWSTTSASSVVRAVRMTLRSNFLLLPPLGTTVLEPDLDPGFRQSDLHGQLLPANDFNERTFS